MHVDMNNKTPGLATNVLLQTFRTWLMTPTHCCYVRCILDNGIQRTFLREDACRKLKPTPIREMDLVISAFGRERSQHTRRAKVVTVTLPSQHDNTSVQTEAVVVPLICDDIIEAPKTNKLRAVIVAEGKPLADAVVFLSVTCEPGVSPLTDPTSCASSCPITAMSGGARITER